MHVPIKVDYGVRALVDLAIYGEDGKVIRSADTSRRTAIPQAYLAQLLHSLRKAGFVKSTRGPSGGHTLALPPDEIRLSSVVDSLDSSENLVQCFENSSFCVHIPACAQREVWKNVEDAVFGILDSITIATLTEKTKAAQETLVFRQNVTINR